MVLPAPRPATRLFRAAEGAPPLGLAAWSEPYSVAHSAVSCVRMPLFRSRATALLEQHLKRKGLDKVWWDSAKSAIAYCEEGDWFAPIVTASGPVEAHAVVRLLGLEPFVQGDVDWGAVARMPRNPFLQDEMSLQFFEERFERVRSRWDEIYGEDLNPTVARDDLGQALMFVTDLVAETPNEGIPLDERGRRVVWSMGSGGYCWRLAEEQTEGPPREEYRQEIAAFMALCPDADAAGERVLGWGAGELTNSTLIPSYEADTGRPSVRIWGGCPGGFAVRFDFFERAVDYIAGGLVEEGVEVSRPDLVYAYTFGLALRDVERWLDDAHRSGR